MITNNMSIPTLRTRNQNTAFVISLFADAVRAACAAGRAGECHFVFWFLRGYGNFALVLLVGRRSRGVGFVGVRVTAGGGCGVAVCGCEAFEREGGGKALMMLMLRLEERELTLPGKWFGEGR